MSTLEIRIYCIFLVVKEKVKEFMAKWKIAAKGLEGTSDIHGNSKTRRGIHFMVELYFTKREYSEWVERNQRLFSTRSEYLRFLLNKVEP